MCKPNLCVAIYVHLCVLVWVSCKDYTDFGFNCECERRPHGAQTSVGMPAATVKPALEDMVAEGGGVGERGGPQWEASGLNHERLPLPSLKVPRELLRSFPHSKRVGSYLVGKMINKGSFAKVMEGLHISTGEKVGAFPRFESQRAQPCSSMSQTGRKAHLQGKRSHTSMLWLHGYNQCLIADNYTRSSLKSLVTCYYSCYVYNNSTYNACFLTITFKWIL